MKTTQGVSGPPQGHRTSTTGLQMSPVFLGGHQLDYRKISQDLVCHDRLLNIGRMCSVHCSGCVTTLYNKEDRFILLCYIYIYVVLYFKTY